MSEDEKVAASAFHFKLQELKKKASLSSFAHQKGIIESERYRSGIVYTPPEVADLIVDRAFLSHLHPPQTIWDPSCGSGVFLIAAFFKLLEKVPPKEALLSLYGSDTDTEALSIARELLLTAYKDITGQPPSHFIIEKVQNQICCEDSLLTQKQDFDCIVGNPPYGLSRDGRISNEMVSILKERFKGDFSGRVNTYLLFIINVIRSLKKEGSFGLIVPNSLLGIQEAKKVRSLLLQEGKLSEILFPEKRIFKEGVESIIIVGSKSFSSDAIDLYTFDSEVTPRNTLSRKKILSAPEVIITRENSTYTATRTLKDIFTPRIALQAYARGKGVPPQSEEVVRTHPFHADYKKDATYLPYLEGRDIKRFSIEWSGSWLSFGPWLAENQPIERYTGPRVLVREILGKAPYLIQAAYTEEPYLYNRSVLHIFHPDKTYLLALTALLNSKVVSEYLFSQGRKSDRKLFPKLLRSDLAGIPIPERFEEVKDELAFIAEKIQKEITVTLEKKLELLAQTLYK